MNYYKKVAIRAVLLLASLLASGSQAIAQATDWRHRALPMLNASSKLLTSADYHKEPVNLKTAKSNEKLVAVDSFKIAGESYYARRDKLNAPYYQSFASAPKKILLRLSAAKKLQDVNAKLAPLGLELFLFDGFRPVSCQKDLWTYFLKRAKLALPKSSEVDQIAYASRYCSNPSRYESTDSTTWPTHCTGGAVDLTLRRKVTGELLYMGSIFDDDSDVSHTDYFEVTKSKHTNSKPSCSDLEARANRRLLYWAMKSCDFENYHYEWWHYDYGNQMWLMNKKIGCKKIDCNTQDSKNMESSAKTDQAFWGPAQ
ncbi:D-alanyl-D-alanine carboxypeptidase family protein [bacterium]|nr:D-alanyl-D-alanine carboxypeptidase family protein [bacterium]MBP9807204.1 D-alanyl-D-alanine carboxypeptidase family protein [bacterium]